MKSGGQNDDRNYEVRLNSFSDGTAKFHGYSVPKGDVSSKPSANVQVAPAEGRPAEVERPTTGGDPDMTTRDMINAGYSAFASFKR